MEKKEVYGIVSYILGIISIVGAVFIPLPGLILGVIGFIHSKKQKTEFSEKGRKLSLIGVGINTALLLIALIVIISEMIKGSGFLPEI